MQFLQLIKKIKPAVLKPVLLMATFLAAYLLGSNLGPIVSGGQSGNVMGETHMSGYEFISPLLECRAPASRLGSALALEKKIKALVDQSITAGKIERASVYLRDLNNGPWIGINEKEEFTPASLLKVPLLISYLKKAEEQENFLSQTITVALSRELGLSPNIIPKFQTKTGGTYSVAELLEYMIKYSDNLAANTLFLGLDSNFIDQVYYDLGLAPPNANIGGDLISIIDYAGFFRILYNSSYLNRDSSEFALKLLSQSDFDQGLAAGLPAGVRLANKFGERRFPEGVQLHDCGIVYRPDNPYLICIMTKGADFESLKKFIADLSALVYKEF